MKRHRQWGFTLVEVLLATTLLGLMMVLLTGSLQVAGRSWDTGEKRMAEASRLFAVGNFLRRHVARLLPVSGSVEHGVMKPSFQGFSNALKYVAPMPDQIRTGGIYQFEIRMADRLDGGKDLRIVITPYQPSFAIDSKPGDPIDDLPLVENIESFRVSYYPLEMHPGEEGMRSRPAPMWMDEWNDNQLPGLIRLDIKPAGENAWPPLLIAPRTRMMR